jgi:serine/threonine protein kinase
MNAPEFDAAADLLEAALFGQATVVSEKQAEADLDSGLPLIEGYALLRLLGEGGFGMVYEAEQKVPIQRRVAVKVLRPGLQTRELLARFEQERQALALMNHPHIAKIFDAGETEDGRPYIVMERVEGTTIDQHSKSLSLGLREKVTLMRDVCRAVAHAHHKGVIHRDLKPSNILITATHDGQYEPRIIDFGIAKALDGPLVSQVLFTQIRQVVGTPGYMSPERLHTSQIPASADTRTDVFALGAVLWELLTGKTPAQTTDGRDTKVALPAAKSVPAELRWIAEKATDPDMNRRYATADMLADDCDAWLEGLPLKAAPRSTFYTIGKWAARHRVAAGALAVLVLSLALFVLVLVRKNQQISEALKRSESSQAERRRAASSESYATGMMRERRRPAQALAHWAQALRDDPGNQAALGMALSTLRHRSFPRPVAPVVALPKGELRGHAVSPSGQWAAMILQVNAENREETLVRCHQGETQAFAIPIPADGRMTLMSLSDEGVVAVAGPSGPVGLLRVDGTWTASDRELAGLRGVAWAPDGRLWMVGALEVARCDAEGREVEEVRPLPPRPYAWAASPDGRFLAFGLEAGKVMVWSAETTEVKTFTAPVPAPFAKIAIHAEGTSIATAWNSGEVWLSAEQGPGFSFSGDPVLSLRFLKQDAGLVIQTPSDLRVVAAKTGEVVGRLALTSPLRAWLPVGDALLTHIPFGRPGIRPLLALDWSEDLQGVDGQVTCAASAWGDVLVLVDEENQVLEWLQKDPS